VVLVIQGLLAVREYKVLEALQVRQDLWVLLVLLVSPGDQVALGLLAQQVLWAMQVLLGQWGPWGLKETLARLVPRGILGSQETLDHKALLEVLVLRGVPEELELLAGPVLREPLGYQERQVLQVTQGHMETLGQVDLVVCKASQVWLETQENLAVQVPLVRLGLSVYVVQWEWQEVWVRRV